MREYDRMRLEIADNRENYKYVISNLGLRRFYDRVKLQAIVFDDVTKTVKYEKLHPTAIKWLEENPDIL